MSSPLFFSLDSVGIADKIREAKHSVCYASPGVQTAPATAMAEVAGRLGPELVTVCLDFDDRVMRMGFGSLEAVAMMRDAGIVVQTIPGLRTGLVIVDGEGCIFTPTALYLESDDRPTDAPNALRLSREQAAEALARLSPASKVIAIALAKSPEEQDRIRRQAVEIRSNPVPEAKFTSVEQSLKEAPPVSFDVARRVRVFEPYLQYVELHLTGAAIQRHRVTIPNKIQNLAGEEGIQSRLKTTFDLIERQSALSSKSINDELNDIRNNLTRSLGKEHGRVVLKAQKPLLQKRLAALREKLEKFQKDVKENLQKQLDASREEVASYYVPHLLASPPDSFLGQLLTSEPTKEEAQLWLSAQLAQVFPTADKVIQKMELEETYKDVTFETLNRKDFLPAVQEAYPTRNWEKTYKEFLAAGQVLSGVQF